MFIVNYAAISTQTTVPTQVCWDEDYRFGFNGMEKDNEISGQGNSMTAEFWQYDSRLGRRWNIDPVVKPWESSYATFLGSPIRVLDPNGDDGYVDEDGNYLGDDGDKESHNTRVINKDVWDQKVGSDDQGNQNPVSDEIRKELQTNVGTKNVKGEEIGISKLLVQYEKGISISEETWKKIEEKGGTKLTPFVQNHDNATIYYKPEGLSHGVDLNPYVDNSGAYPIGPGKDLYSPVDGIKSQYQRKDKVYKVPTGYTVWVCSHGYTDIPGILESVLFNYAGEINAPDPSWYSLRDKTWDW